MPSPHTAPLDACAGFPLAEADGAWLVDEIGAFSGDLDGDGRSDLGSRLGPDEDGVAVWYASDILAAMAAQRGSAR